MTPRALKHLLILTIVIFTISVSCERQDLDPDASSYIYLNKELYPVQYARVVNSNSTEDLNTIKIDIWSKRTKYEPENNRYHGTGEVLRLTFISDDKEIITPGTYKFNSELKGYSFNTGALYVNYSFANSNGTTHKINDGEIKVYLNSARQLVNQPEDYYLIDFDLICKDGSAVTGHFQGKIMK
jgi:hypothetical protein